MENDLLSDIGLLVRSQHGLISIETEEGGRVVPLRHLVEQLKRPYFPWIPTKGLRRGDPTPIP